MTSHVEVEADGPVLVCRLTRPEKRNALTHEMYAAIGDALARVDEDPALRVLVLTGSGGHFTAGNDLGDFLAGGAPGEGEAPVTRFLRLIAAAAKPVVAAVEGLAIGVGVTALLHCDLVYVAPDARLKMPFVDLGLVPEAGSSLLLPQLLGPAKAAELVLLSEQISGTEAVRLGLANEAVEGDVLARALAVAHRLATKAPEAVRLSKQLLRTPAEPIPERMARESVAFARQLGSAEFKEAATAFVEKRPPSFG